MSTATVPRRTGAVVAVALAVGAPLLRRAIGSPAGSSSFKRRTVQLAGIWSSGALLAGPIRPGHGVGPAAAAGAAATAGFTVGALAVRRIPRLRQLVSDVVDHARQGDFRTVATLAAITGITEELLFRGPVYDLCAATGIPPITASTTIYTAVTAVTGNPMLVLAAVPIGLLTANARQRYGGVLAPCVLHVTWSIGMLTILPPLTT